MGLHLDLEAIYVENMNKTGVLRKNNFIINTNDNPTKEDKLRQIEENQERYGLTR